MKRCRKSRINELTSFDSVYSEGSHVIGVDEAGRGPIAGPVTAGAVCFPLLNEEIVKLLKYVDDSKKFSSNPKLRKELSEIIKQHSINSICNCTVEEIDKYNILQASLLAMNKAVKKLVSKLGKNKNVIVLVDGKTAIPNLDVPQVSVIKGDSTSAAIAAASIIAKVHRDEQMIGLSEEFPDYGWSQNKGYPTKMHIQAIKKLGPCELHRRTFLKKYNQLKLF